MQKRKRIIWMIVGAIVVIIGIVGGSTYMSHKAARERNDKLIRHAFQLLEEQTAQYLIEHYSGIKKIEFSPIFTNDGGGSSMFTADVVPVIYDNYGNRAILGGTVKNVTYVSYGLLQGITAMEIGSDGQDIIYIESDDGGDIDVSQYEHLPKEAKFITEKAGIDANVDALVKDGQLKEIVKTSGGSPKAEVSYNLKIEEGKYWEWR